MYIVLRNLRVNGKPYKAGELLQDGEFKVDYEELLQKKYLLAVEEPKPEVQTSKPPVKPKQQKAKVAQSKPATAGKEKDEEKPLAKAPNKVEEATAVTASKTLTSSNISSLNTSQEETN